MERNTKKMLLTIIIFVVVFLVVITAIGGVLDKLPPIVPSFK